VCWPCPHEAQAGALAKLRASETFALSLKISGSRIVGLPWGLAGRREGFQKSEDSSPWPPPSGHSACALASAEVSQVLWDS
jgi:hypothetical protein